MSDTTLNLGANNQLGDVAVEAVAGRDVVHQGVPAAQLLPILVDLVHGVNRLTVAIWVQAVLIAVVVFVVAPILLLVGPQLVAWADADLLKNLISARF